MSSGVASIHEASKQTQPGQWVTYTHGYDLPTRMNMFQRYMPSEVTVAGPMEGHRNYKLLGNHEAEGNRWWGSIADNLMQVATFDYWQLPFMYQGPRKKQNIPPIRITVLTEVKPWAL